MRHALIAAACFWVLAPVVSAQVSPVSRARKFLELYGKGDANGKALAFDVLTPADHPVVLKACFRVLDDPHPQVMSAAVAFLAGVEGEKAVETFVKKGLGHARPHVRYACVASLGVGGGKPDRFGAILPCLADKSWLVRCAALDVLSRFRFAEAYQAVAERTGDEDPRVRVAAVLALEEINDLAFAKKVIASLPDACWPVRSAAIEAVRKLRPRAAFKALINRLAEEKGRLRTEAHATLVYLAGRDLGRHPQAWEDWWKPRAKREGLEGRMDPEYSRYVIKPPKETIRKFFGVPTESKRIVFVLDISASMKNFAKPLRPMKGVKPGDTVTRHAILRHELLLTLGHFGESDSFNVLLFGTKVHAWKGGLTRASVAAKRDAIAFLKSRPPDGETNLFDGLAHAFGISLKTLRSGRSYFAEAGGGASASEIDAGPETIFLLSDGVPNQGSITEPVEIVKEITRLNRVRRIVIHTIAVGRFHSDFLRTLAVENGGTSVRIAEGGVR